MAPPIQNSNELAPEGRNDGEAWTHTDTWECRKCKHEDGQESASYTYKRGCPWCGKPMNLVSRRPRDEEV